MAISDTEVLASVFSRKRFHYKNHNHYLLPLFFSLLTDDSSDGLEMW